jgi:hypothetical protein
MQIAGLIPFSSSIFFEERQEWEHDNGDGIEVYCPGVYCKIFQDGLKELDHYIEEQKNDLSHLKLKSFPYAEDQKFIRHMLAGKLQGGGDICLETSVTSRKHLKAAALMRFLFYENELTRGRHTATVKKDIAAKIVEILEILSWRIFEKIEVAEYPKDRKSDQPTTVIPDNPLKPQYDVVLSFAGEERDYAEKLTGLLKRDGFKVFYDKDEEHDSWGKNLYEHSTEIYSKRGKYCVMFLSKHYAAKQWPTLERRAAQERAFKENREYILPIRIDDTSIPGILDTVAYQDLRQKSIEEIYEILKRKLSLSEIEKQL